MNNKSRSGQRGFTLIEVLVALTVFSAVLSLVLFGLEQGRLSWMKGHKNATFLSQLTHRQFWLDRMFLQANAATFEIDYGAEAPYFLGVNHEVSFVTDAPILGGPGTYALVKLTLNETVSNEQVLVLHEWNNRDPYYGLPSDDSQAETLDLLHHIKNAHWEYYLDARTVPTPLETIYGNFQPRDNDKWSQQYDSRFEVKLPRKIRFIFELNNKPYVWTFNMQQHSFASGQNQPLVLQ